MWIYLTLLVPIIVLIVVKLNNDESFAWYEFLICLFATFIIMFSGRAIGIACSSYDTEFWNSYPTKAEYYEDWNELVTHYETYTDSEGNTHTRTYTTVDYHPETFYIDSKIGTYSIDKKKYYEIKNVWGNEKFVDLHRSYHSNDGDKYETFLNGKIFPITVEKTYKNKVMRSKSVFNFKKLSKEEKKLVFEYPKVQLFNFKYILGYNDVTANNQLAEMNALCGSGKKITAFLLVFKDVTGNSLERAYLQERYWFGGNKNELITCVGVEKNKIIWTKVFSWSDSEEMKQHIASKILKMRNFNVYETIRIIEINIQKDWKKKDFREFEYIDIDLPLWANILIIILSFCACAAVVTISLESQEKY